MDHFKYIVIGGGVSGLAFANCIDEENTLLLEREAELGGYCRTIKRNGFVWDYAGHFFHFSKDETKRFFEGKIQREDLVERTKSTSIYFDDYLVDFPFQANIHQLEKDKFINCLVDLYEKSNDSSPSSFLEMLYAKFGKSITELFLKPYNEKLYACNLDDLDVDAMGRFFPHVDFDDVMKSISGVKVGSYNNTFLYPKNGAKVFIEALSDSIVKSKIRLREQVESIDVYSKQVRTNKQVYSYDYLVNTMPFNLLLERLNVSEFYPLMKELTYNKVFVLNLGFDRKSNNTESHWIYFPQKDISFYRVGFYDNILNTDRLSMYVEIGLSPNEELVESEILTRVISDLKKVGIIDTHELIDYECITMNPAYVHVSQKANSIKADVKAKLDLHSIYSIGRYGDWKYCSIEDSMIDAIDLAKKLEGVKG